MKYISVYPIVIQVKEGESLQAEIDAAPAGSTIFIGSGVFEAPTSAGFHITKSITLIGSGFNNDGGTIIRPLQTGNIKDNVGIWVDASDFVTIENLVVANLTVPSVVGVGHGVWFDNHDRGTAKSYNIIRNCQVCYMGGHGVFFDGEGSLGINVSRLENINCFYNNRDGANIYGCTAITLDGVYSHTNGANGIALLGCTNARVENCAVEGNKRLVTSIQYYMGDIYLQSCHAFVIRSCNFEEYWEKVEYCGFALCLNGCYGGVIECNMFMNSVSTAGTVSISMKDNTRGIRIGPNTHRLVWRTIDVAESNGVQGIIIEPQSVPTYDTVNSPANMGMPSNLPQVNSLDYAPVTVEEGIYNAIWRGPTAMPGNVVPAGYRVSGLQWPGIYTGDTTDLPYKRLMVFNETVNKFQFYNGTAWETFTSAVVTA
jgi:hypothetical protein